MARTKKKVAKGERALRSGRAAGPRRNENLCPDCASSPRRNPGRECGRCGSWTCGHTSVLERGAATCLPCRNGTDCGCGLGGGCSCLFGFGDCACPQAGGVRRNRSGFCESVGYAFTGPVKCEHAAGHDGLHGSGRSVWSDQPMLASSGSGVSTPPMPAPCGSCGGTGYDRDIPFSDGSYNACGACGGRGTAGEASANPRCASRPSRPEIARHVREVRRLRNDPVYWARARTRIGQMSQGMDPDGRRETDYPGWSDGDFEELLVGLDGQG